MLDNRIHTFLELCNVLNYHKVAENLSMTQPAVTQHIKYIENFYQCKLFDYSNRKLSITKQGIELEKYARNIISLSLSVEENLLQKDKLQINIGATKTIGEYLMNHIIASLVKSDQYELKFIIDNTESLINKLNHFELDLLLLEGYVDKNNFLHKKISKEEIVGICSTNHQFAFNDVSLHEVLQENIILRENGSGTRSVFERFLLGLGYSVNEIERKSIISSNKIIENMVENNLAISFVYDVIQNQNPNIASFRIKDQKMLHEFNFVFINEDKAQLIIDLLQQKQ